MKNQRSESDSSGEMVTHPFRALEAPVEIPCKRINAVLVDYEYDPAVDYDSNCVYSPSSFVKYDNRLTEMTGMLRSYSPDPREYIEQGKIPLDAWLQVLHSEAILSLDSVRAESYESIGYGKIFGKDNSSLDYKLRQSLFAIDLAKRMELQATRMVKIFSPFAYEDAKYHERERYIHAGRSILQTYLIADGLLGWVRDDVLEQASPKARDLWARLLVYVLQKNADIYAQYPPEPDLMRSFSKDRRRIYERFITDPLKKYGYEKLFTSVPEYIKEDKPATSEPTSWYDTLVTPAFNFLEATFGNRYATVSQRDKEDQQTKITQQIEYLKQALSAELARTQKHKIVRQINVTLIISNELIKFLNEHKLSANDTASAFLDTNLKNMLDLLESIPDDAPPKIINKAYESLMAVTRYAGDVLVVQGKSKKDGKPEVVRRIEKIYNTLESKSSSDISRKLR